MIKVKRCQRNLSLLIGEFTRRTLSRSGVRANIAQRECIACRFANRNERFANCVYTVYKVPTGQHRTKTSRVIGYGVSTRALKYNVISMKKF